VTRTGTLVTTALVLVLVAAFTWASYLAYYGGIDIGHAFDYESVVVAAQRDSDLLSVGQFEHHESQKNLEFDKKLLDEDLKRIDDLAETDAERPPHFSFPADGRAYQRLADGLTANENAGSERFKRALTENENIRKASNALFALVALLALLFTFVQARLRRRIEEGRTVVESLQRAFSSRRRELPSVSLGTVLISATAGSDVGGDLFDVYAIDARYGAFLVADVSGKGIEAAVDTAFIKYSIRTLIGESRDPGRTLTRFAALFERNIERAETFVVLFLGVIDTQTGEVRYASAGHEPAWMRIGREVTQIVPTGPIVGILDDVEYETKVLRLGAGDTIMITTDGLTESRDGHGAQLGAEGVVHWFAEADGTGQQVADRIVQRLRKRSRRIGDDLAILVLRYMPRRGTSARPLRDRAHAPGATA
jgi:serine phosphatase RsbU (regulator of sigma subunit)